MNHGMTTDLDMGLHGNYGSIVAKDVGAIGVNYISLSLVSFFKLPCDPEIYV
jgi:hypothetical protein